MTKRLVYSVLTICLVTALLLALRPRVKVEIDAFAWEVEGKTATFQFLARNLTDEELTVDVMVIAENKIDGYDGTTITQQGRTKLEIVLGPNGQKGAHGTVELVRFGTLALRLYPKVFIRVPGMASTDDAHLPPP